MTTIILRPLLENDWDSVSKIYAEGISTGLATFETEIPNWKQWDSKYINSCRIVATKRNKALGFAVLSQVSKREVYKGVAEVSVYVAKKFRGRNIGEALLKQLIKESEHNGFWTLQAGIFSKNLASINLHKKCGFRVVGIREKIGQLNGKWYDNHLLEKRNKNI
ncbi:GNAT family N-acetyltransferase [Ichthyenterobacterium magnum]|uniref:Phosphinothricin acetyltransferase n=1 Tax=Ichthyenterobacterium magnum TaxID=1230530 RepID=A0A420DWP8_9FLAO|nr:GNAT family N-acetyltransferase [Ichthyenterobacterium magnum]RKE98633.1 phosphinothricin acetyltransferase [Ichthyenterobacterium magnum]